MAKTVTTEGGFPNFTPGDTVRVDVVCQIGDSAEDITADTVRFFLKEKIGDSDANAVINKLLDVTTQGADGIAKLTLESDDTDDVDPGFYYYEFVWERANGDEYTFPKPPQRVQVYERVSDA